MQQLRTVSNHFDLTADTKANPEFAAAIQSGGPQFRELLRRQQQMIGEKERQIEVGALGGNHTD
jgi:hypothetical protein